MNRCIKRVAAVIPVTVILVVLMAGITRARARGFKPSRFETKNEITVLVLEQPSLPIVAVEVLVRAGAIHDPTEKAGLANMTGLLLEEGTKKRSAVEISEAIDLIGADLRIQPSKDYTTLEMRLLKEDIETGLDLLSDLLINPAFDKQEMERIRQKIRGNILSQKDNPRAIARIAFQALVYGNHPYRHPTIGLEASVSKITQGDLVDFHKHYYRPNNTIVAIVGDITESEAKTLMETHFGGWDRGPIPAFNFGPPIPLPRIEKKHIDKDLSQSTIILGHLGLDRSNPDYYAVQVMNYILGGGGFSSRMMGDIRDNKGLVYSIYSHFTANRHPGAFSVSLQTKNSSAEEAIAAVLREMNKMRDAGVSEEELSEAKSYLTGSFPLRIDTTRKAASLLATLEFYTLGLDYVETYRSQIDRVVREDILRVAINYLHPERYALVVVGKPDGFKVDSVEDAAVE